MIAAARRVDYPAGKRARQLCRLPRRAPRRVPHRVPL